MGYSISWLAVQSDNPESLFTLAQIEPTDKTSKNLHGPISGVALDENWFLLVGQGCDHRLIAQDFLWQASIRWPIVACSVEEHVMFSSAAFWSDGLERWFISHNAQKEIFNLETRGELPLSYEELRKTIIQEQKDEGGQGAGVDLIFDIPLLLAKNVTGFKHDEETAFLENSLPRLFNDKLKRQWWKFW